MNLEKALQYATHHSESIIQWLFFTILVLTGLLVARSLFGKRVAVSSAGASAAGSAEIQSFLEKIMERTSKLEAMPLAGLSEANASSVDAQVQALKKDLASREEEISKLKATGNTAPSFDAESLNSRIKELESKLSEYEILEDDIADLSLFKDENARLKAELEKVKAGGGGGPSGDAIAAAAAATTAVAAEAAAAEAAALSTQAMESVAPPPDLGPADASSGLTLTETGDPMQDFESAVKLEKKLTGGETATIQSAPPSEPEVAAVDLTPRDPGSNQTAPVAPEPVAAKEGDDLFAEFMVAPPAEEETPAGMEESLDTEKMMSEMAALTNTVSEEGSSGLHDESIDTEKMAAEASGLTNS